MATLTYCDSLGYVLEVLETLFTSSVEDLAELSKKYKEKVPEPLNRQFPQRLDKAAAILHHQERSETTITKW
jgi:hypothetical protein